MQKEDLGAVALKDLVDTYKKENELLKSEVSYLKKTNQLVGIVWYGHGVTSIGLPIEINGTRRLQLKGQGAKGIVDYSSWLRLKRADITITGLLVRDDSIIQELGIPADVAPPDRDGEKSNNSFLDAEIDNLLTGPRSAFYKKVDAVTSYFVLLRFSARAKALKINDKRLMDVLKGKYYELWERYKHGLMHYWDVLNACEAQGISIIDKTEAELREALLESTLKNLEDLPF